MPGPCIDPAELEGAVAGTDLIQLGCPPDGRKSIQANRNGWVDPSGQFRPWTSGGTATEIAAACAQY